MTLKFDRVTWSFLKIYIRHEAYPHGKKYKGHDMGNSLNSTCDVVHETTWTVQKWGQGTLPFLKFDMRHGRPPIIGTLPTRPTSQSLSDFPATSLTPLIFKRALQGRERWLFWHTQPGPFRNSKGKCCRQTDELICMHKARGGGGGTQVLNDNYCQTAALSVERQL